MVKITVMLVTKRREPKFEYVLSSLKEQTLSHNDFELIIVDGYYNERRNEVLSLIDSMKVDFQVLYIGDKPSIWKGLRPQICNARNTALIFASGLYIVQVDDCTKVPKDWLEKHLQYLEKGYLIAGSWVGYQFIETDKDGNKICDQGYYGPEHRSTIVKEPKEVGAGWFYGQNCSYSLNCAIDINGFDEYLDGEVGQEDILFGIRAERKGFKVIYDPTNITSVYMLTHGYEVMIPPVNIKLKDGLYHFSNEFVTQKLLEDTGRVLPYGNYFNLKELRELVKGKSIKDAYNILEKYVSPNLRDWRDGKLISDKLKE